MNIYNPFNLLRLIMNKIDKKKSNKPANLKEIVTKCRMLVIVKLILQGHLCSNKMTKMMSETHIIFARLLSSYVMRSVIISLTKQHYGSEYLQRFKGEHRETS